MLPPSTLLTRFADVASRVADRPGIMDDQRTLTFAELARSARCIAGALERRQLDGSRIALLAPAGAAWVEAFLGIAEAGGVVVPLTSLHPPNEQRWFLETSRARAILVSEKETLSPGVAAGLPVLSIDALRNEPGERRRTGASDEAHIALILYTSGTTGKPKGALILHDNLTALAELVGRAWGFSSNDVLLHALPLHHLHGVGISLMVALLSGAATRMLTRFDPERVWEALGTATVFMGVPTQHKKLFDALDAADPAERAQFEESGRRLRLVTSGSAALSPSLGARWEAINGRYPLERYGMTEIGIALSNPLEGMRVPGSVGLPLPGMQVRIVSDLGTEAGPGEAGELWIAGPSVFAGYDGNPDATRAAFRDGWFLSGDTASRDDDGYVTLLGRTSVDILKSGGYKLSALEIEHALREHEAIDDVAVVGVPDETWGDLVVAAVVGKPGRRSDLNEAALRQWAKTQLGAYKVPKRFIVFDELPRNALGKVVKRDLAELVRNALLSRR